MRLRRSGWGPAAVLALASTAANASDYFQVSVTRVEPNLYEVLGDAIYIETRFCLTFALHDRATVRIDDLSDLTVGEIRFEDSGDVCDIRRLRK
jgi:hypothetical protein